MECVQCIMADLVKVKQLPGNSALSKNQSSTRSLLFGCWWAYTVYGHIVIYYFGRCASPLGKQASLTHYVDANITKSNRSGSLRKVLHLPEWIANQLWWDRHSKKLSLFVMVWCRLKWLQADGCCHYCEVSDSSTVTCLLSLHGISLSRVGTNPIIACFAAAWASIS